MIGAPELAALEVLDADLQRRRRNRRNERRRRRAVRERRELRAALERALHELATDQVAAARRTLAEALGALDAARSADYLEPITEQLVLASPFAADAEVA